MLSCTKYSDILYRKNGKFGLVGSQLAANGKLIPSRFFVFDETPDEVAVSTMVLLDLVLSPYKW